MCACQCFMLIPICIWLCVCVCGWVWERERPQISVYMCLLHALSSSLHTHHQHLLKAQTMEVGLLLCKQEKNWLFRPAAVWVIHTPEGWEVVSGVAGQQSSTLCPFSLPLSTLLLSPYLSASLLISSLYTSSLLFSQSQPLLSSLSSLLSPSLLTSPASSLLLSMSLSFSIQLSLIHINDHNGLSCSIPVFSNCTVDFWVWHLK